MKASIKSQRPFPLTETSKGRKIWNMIGWGSVLAVSLYFVVRYAFPYFSLSPEFYGQHWSHAGWLLLHITGGILALLLGPLQFQTALRRKYTRTHRWSGRVYLGSVAVSAVASIYILTLPESSFGFRTGIAGLALAWVSTTALAYLAVVKGQIEQHKEWMTRSYVVTLGFVFFRLLLEPMFALEIATPQEIVAAASWMCWALPLLVTEFILQGRKIIHKPEVRRPGRSR